jgi:hypothetical protein
MDRTAYQDSKFEVTGIDGHVPSEFFALGESAEKMTPEVLLMCMGKDRWHRCFLDALVGFWEVLSDEHVAEVLADYDGVPRVDLLARFDLRGERVVRALCDRTPAERTRISIAFDRGAFVLREADPSDSDSSSLLEFHPA